MAAVYPFCICDRWYGPAQGLSGLLQQLGAFWGSETRSDQSMSNSTKPVRWGAIGRLNGPIPSKPTFRRAAAPWMLIS